jgi:hypothetical protein
VKVYVATKWENRFAAWNWMRKLESKGHVITHDWTQEDAGNADNDYLRTCAAKDVQGVKDCDALVLINHPAVCGALVEFGIALGLGKHLILVDYDGPSAIFYRLPNVYHVKNLAEAVFLLGTL